MPLKAFIPTFFPPLENPDPRTNLAVLNTFGWKAQAELDELNIGFVRKGGSRWMIEGKEAATECVKEMWQ